MKKLVLSLFVVLIATQFAFATELGGKWGVGVRADGLGLRKFINNNFAADIYFNWLSGTKSGQADTNMTGYSVAPMYVKEIYDKTLLEIGATFDGWQGTDASGYYSGLGIYPFIGGEYLMGDHFGLDFKLFVGAYSCQIQGATRTTDISLLDGSMGAHIYF